MDRRAFIAGTLGLLAAPLAAEAQPAAAKVWRVGFLSNASLTAPGMSAGAGALRSGLRELGYVEGENVVLEFRWADGASARLVEFATELVRLKVDAIVAIGPPAIQAAKQATRVVPIVMAISGDPVGLGFVGSLARPAGNVTGVSFLGDELSGKLLELLKQAVPRISRVAVLWNSTNGAHAAYLRDVQARRSTICSRWPARRRSRSVWTRASRDGFDPVKLRNRVTEPLTES